MVMNDGLGEDDMVRMVYIFFLLLVSFSCCNQPCGIDKIRREKMSVFPFLCDYCPF